MNVLRIFGTVCTLGFTLAACGASPTATVSDTLVMVPGTSAKAALSAGGYTVGSGNFVGVPDPSRDGGNETAASSQEEATAEAGIQAERGGYTVGSGN